MPIRITEVKAPDAERTTLRVEGSLTLADAELIERVCRELRWRSVRRITLDLAALSFLDSDAAHLLCRIKAEQGVLFEGLHLFVQRVIEMAEQEAQANGGAAHKNARGR